MVPRSLLAMGVLVLALVAPLPSIAGPLGEGCAEAASSGVALVVDFGDVGGSGPRPGGVEPQCVSHTGALTGGQALIAAGYQLRIENGLLCAINGYPSDGCGERTGERRYLYWSYWKGDGASWQYSGSGISVRLEAGATEGWRFVDGTGSPGDPQPRHAPDQSAICGGDPTPGPAPDPALAAPAPSTPSGSSLPAVSLPGAPLPAESLPTNPDDPSGPVDPLTPPPPSSDAAVANRTDEQAMAVAIPASDGRDLGGAFGFVVVGLVIVVLGVAAVVRTRRGA